MVEKQLDNAVEEGCGAAVRLCHFTTKQTPFLLIFVHSSDQRVCFYRKHSLPSKIPRIYCGGSVRKINDRETNKKPTPFVQAQLPYEGRLTGSRMRRAGFETDLAGAWTFWRRGSGRVVHLHPLRSHHRLVGVYDPDIKTTRNFTSDLCHKIFLQLIKSLALYKVNELLRRRHFLNN